MARNSRLDRSDGVVIAFLILQAALLLTLTQTGNILDRMQAIASFDFSGHQAYLEVVLSGRLPGPSDVYTWSHFPTFYWLHAALVAIFGTLNRAVRLGVTAQIGLFAAAQWAYFRVLRKSAESSSPRLALPLFFATSLLTPVAFLPTSWNQDAWTYPLFLLGLAAIHAAVRSGRKAPLAAGALLLGMALSFKVTVLPLAMLGVVFAGFRRPFLWSGARASALVLVLVLLPNLHLLFSGRIAKAVQWSRKGITEEQHQGYRRNYEFPVAMFLDPTPRVWVDPAYTPHDGSADASVPVQLFTLLFYQTKYRSVLQPPRELKLPLLWSGTAVFALFLGVLASALRRVAKGFRRFPDSSLPGGREQIFEGWALAVVFGSVASLLYFAWRIPLGWVPHIEYELFFAPCAALLALRPGMSEPLGRALGLACWVFSAVAATSYLWVCFSA